MWSTRTRPRAIVADLVRSLRAAGQDGLNPAAYRPDLLEAAANGPLDEKGARQAEGLVSLLAGWPIARILSSPYVRCVQTVEPLAAARGLQVETTDALAEGASARDVLELVGDGEPVALCTHGDVIEALLGQESPKGSVWALEVDGLRVRPELCLRPAV